MDPLKMYFLLNMGYSIAMLVYQRVHVSNGDTENWPRTWGKYNGNPKTLPPKLFPSKDLNKGSFVEILDG